MPYRCRLLLVIPFLLQSHHASGQDLSLKPDDPASAVHPRRFGLPGGIGQTRGWYIWHSFDAKAGVAEVSNEQSGQKVVVRVLPWLTTYRHLAYGANPDELLPGERVNLFFNPDAKQQRAYLVHFQDELCQMKGHNHAWRIEKLDTGGFAARVMAGEKPLDDKVVAFAFDPKCIFWRAGKKIDSMSAKVGERAYLTWCYSGKHRVIKLFSDGDSLDAIQSEAKKRIADRVKREGMTGFVEEVNTDKALVLIFATWWPQAGNLKAGDKLRLQLDGEPIAATLVSRKNLGTYGSGCSELVINGINARQRDTLRNWVGGKVVRVFGP